MEDRETPLLLVSAGVGITPVAAILDDLSARNTQRPLTVAHADRSAASHLLYDAVSTSLSALGDSAAHTWYESVDALGRQRGALPGLMDLSAVPLSEDADVFLCGPLQFMRKARSELVKRGVPAHGIR